MTTFKTLVVACALACSTPVWAGETPQAKPAATVLVAHPVVYALTRQLAEGTRIDVSRVVPDTLPPTRHAAYFNGRGAAALERAAREADAVVGLRAVWADDVLYPHARRANLRIVEIDAARPIDGTLPGVALRAGDADGLNVWLDPTNLGRMADIVAHDLARLAPADGATVAQRLAAFKREVVRLAAEAGQRFAALDNPVVFSLSDRLDYFITGFNLDLEGRDLRTDDEWTPQAVSALLERLHAADVGIVLHHRALPEALALALQRADVRVVVLESVGSDPLQALRDNVAAVLDAN